MKALIKQFILLLHLTISYKARVHSMRLLDLPHLPPTLPTTTTTTSKRRAFLRQTTTSATTIAIGGIAGVLLLPPTHAVNAAVLKSRMQGYPIQTIDGKDWIDVLTSGQYFVLRQGGTEPPNSSPLVIEKRRGVYVCAGCVSPLFDSTMKFTSDTGWPSFATSRRNSVEIIASFANLLGSEVRCLSCGGHLGDVYNDGNKFPDTLAEITGKRYCIDGAALVFVPSDENAEPVVGDGLSQRKTLLF